MQPNIDLRSDEESIDNDKEFRRIVGSLQYFKLTRTSTTIAISKTAQFMAKPQPIHWDTMKRIL